MKRNSVVVTRHLVGQPAARLRLRLIAFALMQAGVVCAQGIPATALPSAPTVTSGQVGIATTGNRMDVTQTTQKGIINWASFNVGQQSSVNFVQPNASAVTLNRVTGGTGTRIDGRLTANGQVFVLNSAGVYFGKDAKVDVGGLVASTMSLSDEDFASGNYRFQRNGADGSVVNEGTITASDGGYVALLSPEARNAGLVVAQRGTVAMAAGDTVTLGFDGQQLVGLQVTPATIKTLVENKQAIEADGGRVILSAMSANELAGSIINVEGTIRADALNGQAGQIQLDSDGRTRVTGNLSARGQRSGEQGGRLAVLGERVALTGTATLDASGDAGGGTVLIGGNWQGQGSERRSRTTYVGSDVSIKADARQTGKGGTVAVWSDGATAMGGSISASGGRQAGAGGRIETSGKRFLDVTGARISTASPQGQVGEWLLDPTSIEVKAAGANATLAQVDGAGGDDLAGAAIVDPALITAVAASSNVTLAASGDITFSGLVQMTNLATSLTAQAGGSIAVNADINTRNGAVLLSANHGGVSGTGGISGSGSITTNLDAGAADITLTTNGGSGSIAMSGHLITDGSVVATTGAGGITLNNATNDIKGTLALTTTGSSAVSVVNTGALALAASSLGTGTLSITAGGDITQTGAITQSAGAGAIDLNAGSGKDIILTTATNNFTGGVRVVSGKDVSITDADALVLGNAIGDTTVSGNLAAVATGAITQAGKLLVTGTSDLTAGAANNITLTTATNNFTGGVRVVSGKDVSITDADALVLGNANGDTTVSGNLIAVATGAITQAGKLLITGTSDLTAGAANNITLATATNNFTGGVRVVSGKDVSITDADALVLGNANGDTTVSGNLTAVATGAITQAGKLLVTGATDLTAGAANNITLATATNNFTGGVRVMSGKDVSITDADALVLGNANGDTTVSGNLAAVATGAITQVGKLAVTGISDLTAGAANNITLATATNNFIGGVRVVSGKDVSITDANALVLGNANGDTTVSGNLTAVATGAITQAGKLLVTGTTDLTAGAANNITLATATNNFTGGVRVVSGKDVSITDADALVLGNANGDTTVSGNLSLQTGGALTQSGTLTVAGTTGITATGFDITLAEATNNFTGAVATTGANVSLRDIDALALGTSTVTGNLSLQTGEALTQTGALTVAGTTGITLDNFNTDISLASAANDLAGTVTIGGDQATIRDFALRNTNAAAAIPENFAAMSSLRNLTLTYDNAPVELPNVVLSDGGNLSVTAGGAITQAAGGIVVPGTASVTSGANAITLNDAANNFAGAVSVSNSGNNNVSLRDVDALDLGTVAVGTGTLTIQSGDALTQTGAITQSASARAVSLIADTNDITLTHADNNFTGELSFQTTDSGNVSVGNAATTTPVTLGGASVVGGSLLVVNGAGITLASGTTIAAGAADDAIVLAVTGANGTFANLAGPDVFSTANGNWRVWSADPANDTLGDLDYAFKHYNAAYENGTADIDSAAAGNGVLYRLAPTITPTLTGTINRVYDATDIWTLANGSTATTGALDGDLVVLAAPQTATFDSKNAGVNKTVTATGFTFESATNNGRPVYGYQVADTATATGTITKAAVSVDGVVPQDKIYDQTTSAQLNTDNAIVAVLDGDDLTLNGSAPSGSFANKTAGTAKAVTVTGFVLAGADKDNYELAQPTGLTASITPKSLSISGITASDKTFDNTTEATVTGSPTVAPIEGDVVLVTGSPTAVFADKAVAKTVEVTVTGYTLTGDDAANYAIAAPTVLSANINGLPPIAAAVAATPLKGTSNYLASPARGSLADRVRDAVSGKSMEAAGNILRMNPLVADLPNCRQGGAGGDGSCLRVTGYRGQAYVDRAPKRIAILISIDSYEDPAIPHLNTPEADTQRVAKALNDSMGYSTTVLHNPSKSDVVAYLNQQMDRIGPNDSVAVYFSGRGYQLGDGGSGYWLTADASASDPSNWLSNADMMKLLSNIPAKQMVLMADGGFSRALPTSGGVTAGAMTKLANGSPMIVVESGTNEPVPYAGYTKHSEFAVNFLDKLYAPGARANDPDALAKIARQLASQGS